MATLVQLANGPYGAVAKIARPLSKKSEWYIVDDVGHTHKLGG
jgi:hypothetical protein